VQFYGEDRPNDEGASRPDRSFVDPWIEGVFADASSFVATEEESWKMCAATNKFADEQHETESPVENTALSLGLQVSGIRETGASLGIKKLPLRESKVVQVIHREGDFGYFDENCRGGSEHQQNNPSSPAYSPCPPYLVLHDGQYFTIAFLSRSHHKQG